MLRDRWRVPELPAASSRVAGRRSAPVTRSPVRDRWRPIGHNHGVAGEFEEIRARLEAIAEELADLALIRLRESIDAGGTELPVDERRLTRARRAVEKAINLLDEPDRTEWP